jgi:hypothetical protein
MTEANMIAPDHPTEAAPLLRREFALAEGHGALVQATLRAGALGAAAAWSQRRDGRGGYAPPHDRGPVIRRRLR